MNGGEISYVATIDTKQLKSQLKDGEKSLLGFNDIAEKAGETLDSVFDINKENIKIQKQVISELESKYKDLSKAIEDIAPGNAKLAMMKEAASIKLEIEAEKKSLIELENSLKSTETTYKSFQTKLNEVKNEMRELEISGQQNSSRYTELSQKAAEYQKANDAVNKSLKALKDNAGLTALVETMGLASGAFSTYQGIVALVGSKNEDLEKIMIRLQSAIAVTVGIQQIQNSLSKESSLLQSIQAVQTLARAKADEIAAASTGKATIAQIAFNLVAKANPYVLLAAAILSVVGAVYLFTRRTNEASNIQKKMNDALKESASNTAKELVELEKLYRTATNDKLSREQRLKAVNALKDAYPGLFQNINDEIILNGKAAASYLAVKDAILEKAKANAAQTVLEEAYTEQLKNQQGYNEELNILYGRTAEIKKRIKKDGEFSEVDGIFGNKVRVNNYDQLRQTRERIGAINKEVGNQNKKLENNYKGVVNTIIKGNAAIDNATTSPSPKKGTGEWYKQEIATLEELRQKAIVGSKEWKILGKQIEEYQNLLNPKANNGTKPTKSSTSVAEEFLPEGSVAEIQRRLSKIDEALSKATNEEQISSLKTKRIATAKELAEAEKLIQIKTLQEQFDESEKLWQQYYSAVALLDKETADKIFGDALKNDKASFESLEKQRADLLAKGNLTDEEKNYFTFIDEKLNSMLGKKNQLDQFKQTIEETLSTLGTDAAKLNFINDKKTTANKTTGEYASLTEYENQILEAQKQRYQEFLAAHQSFEERKNAITENYSTLRQKIEADTTLNNEQKKNALEKAAQEEADAYSDAFMNELLNNPQYREAFADLDRQTTSQLKKIRENLQKSLSEEKNLNPEAQARIRQEIENLDRVIGERNPYQKLINIIKQLGDESVSSSKKMMLINEAADTVTGYVNDVKGVVSDVTGALDDLGIEMSDSSKDLVSSINQTLEGFGQMAEGTKQFAEGYLSGDPIKMVAGTIKYISGAIKTITAWTNGDKKKERQIKAWANEVANLKVQYQELERAMSKALGDDKYKTQQQEIANLEKQKILLQKMIKKEEDKKKTDKGKIKDWQQQISDLNAQIDDLKKSIVDDILQIDVKGLADKIGDALIEGFGRGEDALDSLNKTADDVFRQMVKNALKLQLEKQMQPIIDEMLRAMGYSVDSSGKPSGSFDGLTQEERDALKAKIIAATGDYQKAMEQYADLFGPDAANSPNGLKGDIKGITEKTAGALESQINAIRIYQVEALNVSKRNQQIFLDALKYQAEIAYNTRPLFQIQKDIAELNSKVKKPLAGLGN